MSTILVAFDKNKLIGNSKSNNLPWHIPEDLSLFKKQTTGNAIIMGRKTFDSLPRHPLPNRLNVVVTRNVTHYKGADNLKFVTDIKEGVEFAKNKNKTPYIIGGAEIYKLAYKENIIKKIIVSEIQGEFEGDVYFPFDINQNQWDVLSIVDYTKFIVKTFVLKS